jgi:hypothetical protein
MGVGLHAYAGTEDQDTLRAILIIAALHVIVASLVFIPTQYWMSYAKDQSTKRLMT